MDIQYLITKRLNDRIADSEDMAKAAYAAVARFSKGDWGELCEEDKQANDADLKNRDGHVLAKYGTPEGDIYINPTFDELEPGSNTAMLMFCEEY